MHARPENPDEDQRNDASGNDPDMASVQADWFCCGPAAAQELCEPEKPRGSPERCGRRRDGDEGGTNWVEESSDAEEHSARDVRRHGQRPGSRLASLVAAHKRTQP